MHRAGCQCNVRTFTQTAHRIRRRTLGAFAAITDGCIKVVTASAPGRPDRKYPVEIKAMYTKDCRC